jgi:hypothetical protein
LAFVFDKFCHIFQYLKRSGVVALCFQRLGLGQHLIKINAIADRL